MTEPLTSESITAGNIVFTAHVPQKWASAQNSQTMYTYRINKHTHDANVLFVSVQDHGRFQYLGLLNPESGALRLTARSFCKEDSGPVKVFNRCTSIAWRRSHALDAFMGFSIRKI